MVGTACGSVAEPPGAVAGAIIGGFAGGVAGRAAGWLLGKAISTKPADEQDDQEEI